MGRDSVKLCLGLISVNTICEKCTQKRQYTQSKSIFSKAMHCVGICVCVSCWNLIPMQGESAPDCSTKARVTGQRSDVMDGALCVGGGREYTAVKSVFMSF